MQSLTSSKYLQPVDIAHLRNVVFSSRHAVEGLYAGRHASPQRGHSVEFNDYRPYMPGDEMGDIDWKVFGRSDRMYVKLFEHQTDLTVSLLLDGSASMAYRASSSAPSKYDYAARMCAAIAFLMIRQQDNVAFALAQSGLQQFSPLGGTFAHLGAMLDAMESAKPAGKAGLADAIDAMGDRIRRRGVLIVFSDLLDDHDAVIAGLNRYSHRCRHGGEVILFHVMHAHELTLPDVDSAVFTDSETMKRQTICVADIRTDYDRRLRVFLDRWSSACRTGGYDYNLVSTATDHRRALQQYLFSRAR